MTIEKKNTLQIIATIVTMSIALGSVVIWAANKDAKMAVFLYRVEQTMTEFKEEKIKNSQHIKEDEQFKNDIKEYINQKMIEFNDKAIKANEKHR